MYPLLGYINTLVFNGYPLYFITGLLVFPLIVFVYYSIIFRAIIADSTVNIHTTFSLGQFLVIEIGSIFFIIGHGIHFVTNYLWFSALDKGLLANSVFAQEIYLFDELLGHWFLITGLYLLLIELIILSFNHPSQGDEHKLLITFVILSIVPFASIWAYFVLEGLYAISAICFSLFNIFYCSLKLKSKEVELRNHPMIMYIMIFSIITIAYLLIYYIIFGAFIEPHLL
ncbi:MAG: hypothetical protein INQ03_19095 [Candidatus Heimdallarchaeota archaeon]|nr:hypothetical protein [Candidatus Heimdallarchaeota archaeon]